MSSPFLFPEESFSIKKGKHLPNRGAIIDVIKELRRVMNIEEDVDAMEIFTEGNTVILKKYEPSCLFCNETDFDMVSYKGHSICRKCVAELEKANNE